MKPTLFVANWMLAAAFLATAQKTPESMLGAALHQEEVQGDLKGAIAAYQKVLATPGVSRKTAAEALLQMGRCYEKLGSSEARKAYERVLSNYADQQEITAQARVSLAAIAPTPRSENPRVLTTRLVWAHFGAAISPDGRYVASADTKTGDLLLKDLTTGEERRPTNGGNWAKDYFDTAAFSPDGKQVAYGWFVNDAVWELRVLPIHAPSGSQPRVVLRNEEFPYGQPFEWSPDGKQILLALVLKDKSSQIGLVSVADGSVRILKSLEWRYPGKLSFSPDGRYIAYDAKVRKDAVDRNIFLLSTDGTREIPLVQGPTKNFAPLWTPDGSAVVFISDRNGSAGAWMLRVAEGKPIGDPELLKDDMGSPRPVGIARDGSYYYTVDAVSSDIYTAEIEPATGGVVTPPARVTERYLGTNNSAAWSPDGQYLAFLSRRTKGFLTFLTLVIRSVKSGEEREIPTNLTFAGPLRWLPDGRSVVTIGLNGNADAQRSLHRVDVRTGEDLTQPIEAQWLKNSPLSPDGKKIYYQKRDWAAFTDRIFVRDLETRADKELYKTSRQEVDFALSPDGRQLAVALNELEARSASLQVMPAEGGAARELFKGHRTNAIVGIDWAPGGRYLVFGGHEEPDLWRIPVEGGAPQKLEFATRTKSESVRNPRIHPDGRRIAFSVTQKKAELWTMQNFLPAVSRK